MKKTTKEYLANWVKKVNRGYDDLDHYLDCRLPEEVEEDLCTLLDEFYIYERDRPKPCNGIHSTDMQGKCFNCGIIVITKDEPINCTKAHNSACHNNCPHYGFSMQSHPGNTSHQIEAWECGKGYWEDKLS